MCACVCVCVCVRACMHACVCVCVCVGGGGGGVEEGWLGQFDDGGLVFEKLHWSLKKEQSSSCLKKFGPVLENRCFRGRGWGGGRGRVEVCYCICVIGWYICCHVHNCKIPLWKECKLRGRRRMRWLFPGLGRVGSLSLSNGLGKSRNFIIIVKK